MVSKESRLFVMVLPVKDNIGERGFTLVELMIVVALSGIIMAGVMTAFLSQHRSYIAQDEVVEMQQNARVAMDMLARDIRSAGYNPNNIVGGAGITAAGNGTEFLPLTFTRDDGTGVLETISYSLYDAFSFAVPPDNDGLVDDLGRNEGGGRQVIAENISRLEFLYLDANGGPTVTLDDIRSIQVSILVQTSRADVDGLAGMWSTLTPPYITPSGAVWTPTPGFRSRYLTTRVQCRNLGL